MCAIAHQHSSAGPKVSRAKGGSLRAAGENPRAAVDALLDAALGAGGKDNVSIILVTVRA